MNVHKLVVVMVSNRSPPSLHFSQNSKYSKVPLCHIIDVLGALEHSMGTTGLKELSGDIFYHPSIVFSQSNMCGIGQGLYQCQKR